MTDLMDADPYGTAPDGVVHSIAAEIRDAYCATVFGATPAGDIPGSVIARLTRIEQAVNAPAVTLTDAQATALGAQILTAVEADLTTRIATALREVLGSLAPTAS